MSLPLTPEQKEYILLKKGSMKQVDIARVLGVTPVAVNYIVKGRKKGKDPVPMGCFDIDKEAKEWGIVLS